MLIMQIPNSLR